ncbi:MAG: hypothetical protein E7366_01200 [Clostridiales bacterium]|nr:hypothetical protein [Clostridiales bacterium]
MTYVLSDPHAEFDLFIKLLEKIEFSAQDKLIVCGDIVDKGKNSIRLLQYIKNMPNARCIIGNHEHMFLQYYWSLMQESPDDFDAVLLKLQQYFPYDGAFLDWEEVDWLETLPYYIEEKDFICVHAGLPMDAENKILPLAQAEREQLIYDRRFKDPNVLPNSDKCVFFGHTPTSYIGNETKILTYCKRENSPSSVRDFQKVHLDLGTWLCGKLGCFCVETCETHYVEK